MTHSLTHRQTHVSVVKDKLVCSFFNSFLTKIAKFTKDIWEPVIENIIILGHLMADTSSKGQKNCEICHIFTYY